MATRSTPRTSADRSNGGGGRPGMPGPIAVTLMFVVSAIAAFIDVLTGPGLRTLFAVALLLVTALVSFLVARRDALWVVFAPPLICLALALINVALTSHSALGLAADYLTHGFPPIALAVALAAVITGGRALAARAGR